MLSLMRELVMENRSIVGDGYDRALARIGREIDLTVHEFPSGSRAWTWEIPNAWDVREAWIEAEGRRLVDFADHPLHVWSHSLGFRGRISRAELLEHLTTNPDRPDAIPFDFRYYERNWGFSVPHTLLSELTAEEYDVCIDVDERSGTLKVGEHVIEGQTDDCVVILAHLDHAGQANDDLAGCAVAVELARRMAGSRPYLTHRFLFVPEQIGTIAWLSRHEHLIPTLRHGVFLEMLGNDQPLALQHSKQALDAVDRAFVLALSELDEPFLTGRFLEVIVNDEQVLNGPGVNVPTVSISRATPPPQDESKVAQFFTGLPYPEYHTSDDSMDIIREDRLEQAADVVARALEILDADTYPRRQYRGPVHLSSYGLWVDWCVDPDLNQRSHHMMWCFEGDKSLSEIALECELPFETVRAYVNRFVEAGLIELSRAPWTGQAEASANRTREIPSASTSGATA